MSRMDDKWCDRVPDPAESLSVPFMVGSGMCIRMVGTRLGLGGEKYCKRCATGYTGNPRSCPHCSFNPKQRGLRIALVSFLIVVVSLSAAQVSLLAVPTASRYLAGIAAIAFVITVLVMGLSYLATPHRFARVFVFIEGYRH